MKQKAILLLSTSFLCGFLIMVLELLGFRMLAPYFGYSSYVSGSLIGIVMIALTAGYYLGGRVADRSKSPGILYRVIAGSCGYLVFVYFTFRPLLLALSRTGIVAGSMAATAVIFGPPMLGLSMASPFIIRWLSREENVGTTAGTVFAISTAGSILGTFLCPFVLLPAIGTSWTLFAATALTGATATIGLSGRRRALPLIALLPAAFASPWLRRPPAECVYEVESPYNLIRVLESGGVKMLRLNSPVGVQSFYETGRYLLSADRYYGLFAAGPLLSGGRDALVLGVGGGTSVRTLHHFYPDLRLDAVEIDPEVVRVAKTHFDLQEGENLRIIVEDARPYLRRTDRSYDFIEVDLYHGGCFMPFYVATVEFFRDVHARLRPGGVLMMNVLAIGGSDEISDAVARSVAEVFPSLYLVRSGHNHVLVATREPRTLDEIRRRVRENRTPELNTVMSRFVDRIVPFSTDRSEPPLTDDRSNLTALTFRAIRPAHRRVMRDATF